MLSEIYLADVAIYDNKIVIIGNADDYIETDTQVISAKGFYLASGR